jgi:hypothetical protein
VVEGRGGERASGSASGNRITGETPAAKRCYQFKKKKSYVRLVSDDRFDWMTPQPTCHAGVAREAFDVVVTTAETLANQRSSS